MKTSMMKAFVLTSAITLGLNAQTVGDREANQQRRIGQGLASGQLTPHETRHVEHREAHVAREVHRDGVHNGGHLSAGERAKVNHQQNRVSRSIYRDKHNAAVQ